MLLDIFIMETIGLRAKTRRYVNPMIFKEISLTIFVFMCTIFAVAIWVNMGHYLDKYQTVTLFILSLVVIHIVKKPIQN